jgi:transposase
MRPINKTKTKNAELHLKNGKSEREVASILRISKSMVHKIRAGLKMDGPKLIGGRIAKLTYRGQDLLCAFCGEGWQDERY